jgi:hypothetical protein
MIGARNISPIYETINQLDEVIKNKYLYDTASPQIILQTTVKIIQKKHMNAKLNRLVFLGVAEKYPVIRIKTLTPMIVKPSNNNAPNDILSPKDSLVV